jgi:hypothetical protein
MAFMVLTKRVLLSITFIMVFSITACTSTKLTSVWKDTTYDGYIESILVVAVTENVRNRLIFESEFVKEFKKVGIEALASVDATPQDEESSENDILTEARKQAVNTILVTHLISVDEKSVYHPPKTYAASRPAYTTPRTYHGRFHTYYPRVYEYVHEPGYYTQQKSVNLETNLYETETEKLIWSVTSETLDPQSVNKIIESLSTVVIKNLQKNKLLR